MLNWHQKGRQKQWISTSKKLQNLRHRKTHKMRFFLFVNYPIFQFKLYSTYNLFCKADLNQVILARYYTLLHSTALYCTLLNRYHHFSPVLYMMCNTTKYKKHLVQFIRDVFILLLLSKSHSIFRDRRLILLGLLVLCLLAGCACVRVWLLPLQSLYQSLRAGLRGRRGEQLALLQRYRHSVEC